MFRLLKKAREDRGSGELISILFGLPLILGILFTIIDFTFYGITSSQISDIARDSARTVAIFGGTGDANVATPIENEYGIPRSSSCDSSLLSSAYITQEAYRGDLSAIECELLTDLIETKGIINSQATSVSCGPRFSPNIGDRASCTIQWNYNSIPASALNFMSGSFQDNLSSGSSNTEVRFSESDLVRRR